MPHHRYLIGEDEERIILAATFGFYSPQEMVSNSTVIPKVQVKRMLDIDELIGRGKGR